MSFSKYGGLFMEKLKLVDKLKNKGKEQLGYARGYAIFRSTWKGGKAFP